MLNFESLATYNTTYADSVIPENVSNVVRDLSVKYWCPIDAGEYKLTLLERLITEKRTAIPRLYDFGDLTYPLIQNAAILKRPNDEIFIITMPDIRQRQFNAEFNTLIAHYNKLKRQQLKHPSVDRFDWQRQMKKETDLQALVINNRYKMRTDGKIVAIIGTSKSIINVKYKVQ